MVYMLIVVFVLLLVFFLPIKGNYKLISENPKSQYNERNTMFSRREISSNDEIQNQYYKDFPEHKSLDEDWLQKPGLMSEESSHYERLTFKAADASFDTIGFLKSRVDGPVNPKKEEISADKLTNFLRNWGLKIGAISVGFCEMQKYHFYSMRGRGAYYGKEVVNNHKYGIALTVEMDEEFLSTGPAGPTLMESARQYLDSGVIAIQLGEFLRKMGYKAKAHIDGNYEVIAPLVARDAGLGEIGRMGLLMTPQLGPRVRIAIVTTNAPIIPDIRKSDYTVHDFCQMCKKCALICPSQAIPKTDIEEMDGAQRWQINHEKCFGYWCTAGTDCGRCMSVCPYAHKNNALHNFVRWGIKNNLLFRRVAVHLDDVFYGRKPKPKKVPEWME